MHDLAAKKVERSQGFQKEQSRRGHTSSDHQSGDLLQQCGLFRSKLHPGWRQSKGVDEFLT